MQFLARATAPVKTAVADKNDCRKQHPSPMLIVRANRVASYKFMPLNLMPPLGE